MSSFWLVLFIIKSYSCKYVFLNSSKTIIIKIICTHDVGNPLTNQNARTVSTNYNHLENLKLTDSSNSDTKNINPSVPNAPFLI